MKGRPSDRFVRLSQLRKLSACEQVAAVCYRIHNSRIEFLLVRTRGGRRWTFPKGSAEPGLTHAQAAALEAFEEAGVHGRIEETPFARYRRPQGHGESRASKAGEKGIAVNAYLCEVLRLSPPQESKRDRTWFSVEDARQRLQEGRKKERRENNGEAGIGRVVDRALARIQKLRGTISMADRPEQDRPQQDRPQLNVPQKDALQMVRFDFSEAYGWADEARLMPHIRRVSGDRRRSSTPILHAHSHEFLPCEVLEFGSARGKKSKALGSGSKTG
jgi:8-oxo-dGTP pyrophosphatase MutT (NUDIX family)